MLPSPFRIFAAEDDETYARLLRYLFELDPENEVRIFGRGQDLLTALADKPHLVTLDYSLPDFLGTDLLKRVKSLYPDVPVLLISGQEDISTAVALLKSGAYDYICKDAEIRERLLNSLGNLKRNYELQTELAALRQEVQHKYEFEKAIIGNSAAIRRTYALLEKASQSQITVSVTGETGTGKEMVAKAIHYNSSRRNKPFVPVNVAAIPSELLESELFGHEKGAFTGAVARRLGKFEEAQGGTLFLDEIGEMPLSLQAKILRVLQEREVVRIGSNTPIKLDIRLIVATHRSLNDEVKEGRFRQDLYYRLLGLPIHLPPLRERENDVLLLARHFLDTYAKENKEAPKKLSPSASARLKQYPWPGNVRELKAVVELSAVMATGGVIEEEDIVFSSLEDNLLDFSAGGTNLDDYIFRIVRHYMNLHQDQVQKVADVLQVGKSTIYRYLKTMEERGL